MKVNLVFVIISLLLSIILQIVMIVLLALQDPFYLLPLAYWNFWETPIWLAFIYSSLYGAFIIWLLVSIKHLYMSLKSLTKKTERLFENQNYINKQNFFSIKIFISFLWKSYIIGILILSVEVALFVSFEIEFIFSWFLIGIYSLVYIIQTVKKLNINK